MFEIAQAFIAYGLRRMTCMCRVFLSGKDIVTVNGFKKLRVMSAFA